MTNRDATTVGEGPPLAEDVTPRAERPSNDRTASIAVGSGLLALLLAIAGCGVTPRISLNAATALAQTKMDVIETPDMLLYFPRHRRAEALRFIAHTEPCLAILNARKQIHNGVADAKVRVILPELPYNNADVNQEALGREVTAVIGSYATIDIGSEIGHPLDPGVTACHELTHYIQGQQLGGFWRGVYAILGPTIEPQAGLDFWFWEGLATYYETVLQPGVGRMAWPLWHGLFVAGVAGRRLNGGDLSHLNRDDRVQNSYLVGSHFIRFLAERYGEEKLWRLIAVQGRSILFPLGVNVRFWQVYDKSLSTLIGEFADDVADRHPARARPPEQRILLQAGIVTRYARAANGTQALIDQDRDRPTRLMILDAAGQVQVTHDLTDVVPPRKLAAADPRSTGGVSFTADGKSLFFVAADPGPTYQRSRLIRYDLPTDTFTVVVSDLGGPGGSISPDGKRYWFSRADGDRYDLAEVDVATGAIRVVQPMAPGAYVLAPRFSPAGAQVVADVFEGGAHRLALFDGMTGRKVRWLPTGPGPAFDASFVDENRIVYLGTVVDARTATAGTRDQGFQVYLQDLASGQRSAVTQAPYLAFQPQAVGGRTVRFLNREGWTWTLDEVPLPAPVPAGPAVEAHPDSQTPVTVPPSISVVMPTDPPASLAATATASPDPVVISQEPYRPWSTLFVPRMIEPAVFLLPRPARSPEDSLNLGLTVLGYDRLQYHLWNASIQFQPTSRLWSTSLTYINRQLAPYIVTINASQWQTRQELEPPAGSPAVPGDTKVYQRERILAADLTRAFYLNPVSVGAALIESYRPDDPNVALPLTRVVGPYVAVGYSGVETAPYTGSRRGVEASGRAAYYPRAWSANQLQFADLRADLKVVTPLPLSRRHTLIFEGIARTLHGAPDDQALLQVGGVQPLLTSYPARPVTALAPALIPPPALMVESLRGFEDYELAANTFLTASATYRYPFIIDRGAASTLGVFPSVFWSQIDLQLFGQLTRTALADQTAGHAVVGGSLTAFVQTGMVPLEVTYQLSRRLTDDRLWTHFVGLNAHPPQ